MDFDQRIFPICYSTARSLVKRLGDKMEVKIRPHDLRRHSATYASRNGIPLKVISKMIFRHQDLKTTQMYLDRISEAESSPLDGRAPRQVVQNQIGASSGW